MGNVVRSGVDLDVLENSDTADIVSSSNEDTGTDITGDEVELDGVVDVDLGVGVTDGSTVVGDDVWDGVLANALLGDLAELELSLLLGDLDGGEASLNVVKD